MIITIVVGLILMTIGVISSIFVKSIIAARYMDDNDFKEFDELIKRDGFMANPAIYGREYKFLRHILRNQKGCIIYALHISYNLIPVGALIFTIASIFSYFIE